MYLWYVCSISYTFVSFISSSLLGCGAMASGKKSCVTSLSKGSHHSHHPLEQNSSLMFWISPRSNRFGSLEPFWKNGKGQIDFVLMLSRVR